jgi:hypothetical protein
VWKEAGIGGMKFECWSDAVHIGKFDTRWSFRLRPAEPEIFENVNFEDVVLWRDDRFGRAPIVKAFVLT